MATNVSIDSAESRATWINRRFAKVTTHYIDRNCRKNTPTLNFHFSTDNCYLFPVRVIFSASATPQLYKWPTFNSITAVVCAKIAEFHQEIPPNLCRIISIFISLMCGKLITKIASHTSELKHNTLLIKRQNTPTQND